MDSFIMTYDGLGRLVEQANGTTRNQILYSPIGKLGTLNGQTLNYVVIPLPGGDAAEYRSGGALPSHYHHSDWLGSSRLASSSATPGAMFADLSYAPFGEAYSSAGNSSDREFTNQREDTVTNFYNFLFREYHVTEGRWISPDPAGLDAVDPSNPQTWNRYAYVGNSPLDEVDSDGLCGLITAGLTTSPDSTQGQDLIALAEYLGFNVAFPYAGQSLLAGANDIAFVNYGANQTATDVARDAILATQLGSVLNDTGFIAIGFSGGAQANVSVFRDMGIIPNASNTILLDPGLGPGPAGTVPGGANIFRGTHGASPWVNLTSAGGITTSVDCRHDPVCLLTSGLFSTGLGAVLAAGACPGGTIIFTRGRPPRHGHLPPKKPGTGGPHGVGGSGGTEGGEGGSSCPNGDCGPGSGWCPGCPINPLKPRGALVPLLRKHELALVPRRRRNPSEFPGESVNAG